MLCGIRYEHKMGKFKSSLPLDSITTLLAKLICLHSGHINDRFDTA